MLSNKKYQNAQRGGNENNKTTEYVQMAYTTYL